LYEERTDAFRPSNVSTKLRVDVPSSKLNTETTITSRNTSATSFNYFATAVGCTNCVYNLGVHIFDGGSGVLLRGNVPVTYQLREVYS